MWQHGYRPVGGGLLSGPPTNGEERGAPVVQGAVEPQPRVRLSERLIRRRYGASCSDPSIVGECGVRAGGRDYARPESIRLVARLSRFANSAARSRYEQAYNRTLETAGVPFDVQWPRGFKSEDDVVANPGARVINEGNVFPASKPGEHMRWTRSTQSNLYQIALPK